MMSFMRCKKLKARGANNSTVRGNQMLRSKVKGHFISETKVKNLKGQYNDAGSALIQLHTDCIGL